MPDKFAVANLPLLLWRKVYGKMDPDEKYRFRGVNKTLFKSAFSLRIMSGPVAALEIQRTTIWTTNIVVSKDIELSIIYKWHPQPSIHLKWQNTGTNETRKFIYKNADLKGWLKLLERLRPESLVITVAAGFQKEHITQVRTIRSRLNGAPNMWGSDCYVNDRSNVRYLEWIESLADLPSIGLRVYISRRGQIETVFNIFEAILQLLIQKLPPRDERSRTFTMYLYFLKGYHRDTCQQWADDRVFSARFKDTMASVDLPEGATVVENFSSPPKMEQRVFVLAQGVRAESKEFWQSWLHKQFGGKIGTTTTVFNGPESDAATESY